MLSQSDIIYVYDGSFEGFLTCVYDCVYCNEMPIDIIEDNDAEPTMYLQKYIKTDESKAAKVYASISRKICPDAQELVNTVFLSDAKDKEIVILRFLLSGYKRGKQIMYLLSNGDVAPMYAIERNVKNEAHMFIELIRFSDYGGVLATVIHPHNFVLPLIRTHFLRRLMRENFIIYDETHKAAFVYYKGRNEIITLDALQLPQADKTELEYRDMWITFYNTIAIEARENPKCRMTHCPKRYWADMLEMRPELDKSLRIVADESSLKAVQSVPLIKQ